MQGYGAVTKSYVEEALICAYKAAQHKIHKVRSVDTPPARRGKKIHDLRGPIRLGQKTLEETLGIIAADPIEEDREEVAELLRKAIADDPVTLTPAERQTYKIEQEFAIDAKGKLVKFFSKRAILRGRLDDLFRWQSGVVRVTDLKSGWEEPWKPRERNYYVLGAKALYPQANVFEFAYHFVRSGNYPIWRYEFGDKNRMILETDPNGKVVKHKFGKNPLLVYLETDIAKINDMEEVPTPGPHCENFYGAPCQFFGTTCPAAKDIPQILSDVAPVPAEQPDFEGLLKAIVESSDGILLTPEQASWALAGQMQLEGFVKALKSKLHAHAQKHGPIRVGDTDYGWFTVPENDVDKAFVLQEMLAAKMPIDEIAKVLSISKTNIDKKISKRQHPKLRQYLLAFGVSVVDSKPKFGPLVKVEDQITE